MFGNDSRCLEFFGGVYIIGIQGCPEVFEMSRGVQRFLRCLKVSRGVLRCLEVSRGVWGV